MARAHSLVMDTLIWATAVAFAVIGGIYFTFSSFVMDSLAELPSHQGIGAMQSINRVILSSGFMVLFFATTIAALGLGVWGTWMWGSPGSTYLVAGALLYLLGMFAVTALGNVPLNDALDAVDPTTPAAAEVWATYLRDWTRLNTVRTVASIAASGLLILSTWAGR